MKYSQLGSSGLEVSRICLGTMTWGTQNTQADADQQIDYALDCGINFIDTAEMYSVPPTPKSYGATETIIGNWLSKHPSKRDGLVLATKIAGSGLHWIRNGGPITGAAIEASVDASLTRLQSDYIDLYQLHWPNRSSPHFGKHHEGDIEPSRVDRQAELDGMLDILNGLQRCIDAGKIRHFGLSDDTPWGISSYLRLASEHGLSKPVSIQNEFSLLHAKDWPYLIELCVHENVAYLPWSALATGVLTGKYMDGKVPKGSRWSLSQRHGLFRNTDMVHAATRRYVTIAKEHGLTSTELSLAWCNHVDGVTSTIIGATTMEQLRENIAAFDLTLSDDVLKEVRQALRDFPSPF